MYEKYFQLRERPFALSPDPDYLYPSRVHQEALSYLRYGIEGRAGFVVITGEIGSGKTTMLQSLLGRLDNGTTVARVVNTMLDPRELLEAVMIDFGLDPTGLSKPMLLHRLGEFLVQQRQAGRLTLLVIDEAQNLSLPALEEIRMLSNLETEKSKLVQIIMIGQPELREKLALPQLMQLRQRITVSYHLQPLDAGETANYINHRLKRAAVGAALEFPRDVTDLVHQRSGGVPRVINVIADATLLFAYGVDRRAIDLEVTRDALAELDATGVLASYQTEGVQAAAATTVSVAETQEAMRIAGEVHRREAALAQRERDLAQREQAITAQQRVVEEEARLLAAARGARLSGGAQNPIGATPGSVGATPTSVGASRNPAGARQNSVGARPNPVGAPLAPTRDSAIAPTSVRPIAPTGVSPIAPTSVRPLAPARASRIAPTRDRSVALPQPQPRPTFWDRVRRVLLGVTEPEAGA